MNEGSSRIYIDTDELPGSEVAPGGITYLRIDPKKEHYEAFAKPMTRNIELTSGKVLSSHI